MELIAQKALTFRKPCSACADLSAPQEIAVRAARSALAALVLLAPSLARAQDAGDAARFVRGLYGAYHGKGPDYLGRQAPATFSPGLLRLIRQAAAQTPAGEVGALDGDPICDCQDFGVSRLAVTVSEVAGGRAQATARFRNLGDPRTVRLDLAAIRGHWRVDDIHTTDTPSYAAYLRQSLRPTGARHGR